MRGIKPPNRFYRDTWLKSCALDVRICFCARRLPVGYQRDCNGNSTGAGSIPNVQGRNVMQTEINLEQPTPANDAATIAGLWYVLHTKSRQEKVVAEFLTERQIRHVLPLVTKTTYCGKRKLKSELPLFPGYVFLKGSANDAYSVDRTKRLVRIIPVFDQLRLNLEIESLTRALAADKTFDPHPFLVAGTRVVVQSGPLRGTRGIIESRGNVHRLVLQIEILGQAVSMEIDAGLVEPVDHPAMETTAVEIRAA